MGFQRKRRVFSMSALVPVIMMLTVVASLMNAGNAYAESDPGEQIFKANCAVCHGAKGDSMGQVCFSSNVEKSGRTIKMYSRDFTLGVFKLRSTSTGCLPDDSDLVNTLNNGIPRSFMPSFKDLSSRKKEAVLEYVKTFSERWEEEDPCDTIAAVKPSWVGSPGSIVKGEKVYKAMKCWECHGDTGKGDGLKADRLKDDWGHKIVPFDFTLGELKRGTSPEAIYMTFTTGLDGTGMPSYEDTLGEEDRWHLVSYTLKLMGR